ncbi:hypothetical protein V5799_014537, partial [Amblyomma americanum]
MPVATQPTTYENLREIVHDFCRDHEVTVIPGPIISQETSATFGEMLQSADCLMASACIDKLRERHEGPPWNLVLFPDPVKRYKLLLLWESTEKLKDVLGQTAVEHHSSDYVFRLWALGNHPSICGQCGIIQNNRGLKWYTGLSGLNLNVGAVHEVDFALGGLSVFYFRFLFIDFVYPYITDVFAFVSKAPTRIPLTQAIVYPFQKQ